MIRARFDIDLSPADGLVRGGGLRLAARIGVSRAASPVKASVVGHALGVRRFGFLAKSIRVRLRSYPADRWVSVIGPGTGYVRSLGRNKKGRFKGAAKLAKPSKYAHLVEKGTRHSRAKPWLKPAYDESAPRFLARVGVEVGKEVEKVLARRRAGTGT